MSLVDTLELPAGEVGGLALDDAPLWEVVAGQEVSLPIMGVYEGSIASELSQAIGIQAKSQGSGRVVTEVLFRIDPSKSTSRRPDVAFVSFERWGRERKLPVGNHWEVVPDLVVEVVSPTDMALEIMNKVYEYLSMGVTRVWVIYPSLKRVLIFDTPEGCRPISPEGTLDGENLIPGFQMPLAELFRDGPEV